MGTVHLNLSLQMKGRSMEKHITMYKYKNRWISYFDLLGFQKLVEKTDLSLIIQDYEKILDDLELKTSEKKKFGIDYSWFSDTFLIFAKDDSLESFTLIEQASRLFFQRLISRNIPLRGALTVGELYTQKDKNIFLGKGIIDAYKYGEGQNWIGFILTPGAYMRLKETNLDLEHRLYYRRIIDPKIIKHPDRQNVFAFTMNALLVNNQNLCLEAILRMKELVKPEYRDKYQNTENFIISSAS